jgi:hypothetical protein
MARLGRAQPFPVNVSHRIGSYAEITGTITASTTEGDIVAGGKTIIITLIADEWVAAGAPFDGQRQNIINGLDSAQAEATGWNTVVRDTEPVASVVRTSATVVTITLVAHATYDITAPETITVTVPGTALLGTVDITATPTFTVSEVTLGQPYRKRLGGVPFVAHQARVW